MRFGFRRAESKACRPETRTTGRKGETRVRKVLLISSRECQLCEKAREIIRDSRRSVPFDFQEVFLENDPSLEAQRTQIPVILIDGRIAFKYRVEKRLFISRLKERR